FVDGANLGLFLVSLLAARAVLFNSDQRNIVLEMAHAGGVLGVNLERVFIRLEVDVLPLGVDLMLAVRAVPLRDGRVLMHILDNLPPADAGVVSTKGNFALLRGIRDDAHLGAAEVVVEQVLEPHSSNEEEVPRILSARHNVFESAVRRSAAILGRGLLGERPGLVELLKEIVKRQALWPFEWVIVFEQRQGH